MGNGHEVIARLALTDINAPYYEGDSAETLQFDLQFELDLDEIAKHVPGLLASRLIYHRAPVTSEEDPLDNPRDIDGRCLVVTEKRVGSCNIWSGLNAEQKVCNPPLVQQPIVNIHIRDNFWTTLQRSELLCST